MATSAVPAAITAFVAILQAAAALGDVDIIDGPPTDDVATQDILCVGWSPQSSQAAELVQDFNSAGARTRNEEFTVHCYIDVWSGDDGFAAVRDRVFAIFAYAEDALRATNVQPTAPTLGGKVLWAHLTRGVLLQSTNDQGIKAGLAFTLSCHARI